VSDCSVTGEVWMMLACAGNVTSNLNVAGPPKAAFSDGTFGEVTCSGAMAKVFSVGPVASSASTGSIVTVSDGSPDPGPELAALTVALLMKATAWPVVQMASPQLCVALFRNAPETPVESIIGLLELITRLLVAPL